MPSIKLTGCFIKAQVSSIVSTLADFLVTHLFTEVLGFWYLFSSVSGTILGGLVNFLLGRYWTFKVANENKFVQAQKYLIIWVVSLLLNTSGVYVLTDWLGCYYMASKVMVSISVGVFFNFYFQKTFVFKNYP